jgi:hypothetical protein
MNLLNLPDELLINIIVFIPSVKDICMFSKVCWKMNKICKDNIVWKKELQNWEQIYKITIEQDRLDYEKLELNPYELVKRIHNDWYSAIQLIPLKERCNINYILIMRGLIETYIPTSPNTSISKLYDFHTTIEDKVSGYKVSYPYYLPIKYLGINHHT